MNVKPLIITSDIWKSVYDKWIINVKIDLCGCWKWQGHKCNGYGTFYLSEEKRNTWAHRVAYALFVEPIKEDMVIDHDCRNHGCVRPDHLIQDTHQQNCMMIHVRKRMDYITKLEERQLRLFE